MPFYFTFAYVIIDHDETRFPHTHIYVVSTEKNDKFCVRYVPI